MDGIQATTYLPALHTVFVGAGVAAIIPAFCSIPIRWTCLSRGHVQRAPEAGRVTKVVSYGVAGNEIHMSGLLIVPVELSVEIEAVKTGGNSIVTRGTQYNITA